MCTQCLTEAVVVVDDVLPGMTLMRAVVDHAEWPAGWFGLVKRNDPLVVFPVLVADPDFSDEVINAGGADVEAALAAYDAAVKSFDENLKLTFTGFGELFMACTQAGYDSKVHGFAEYWLVNHLARKVAASSAETGM